MSFKKYLLHNAEAFSRDTLNQRMKNFGFKNMGRLELFLWDLEMFLQIQKILGDKIALKGGAAVQFYLPMEAQRTSVDIDMIYCGSKEDMSAAIIEIENKMADETYFHFRSHKPKNPKTKLSLYTYFTKIPTVLTSDELNYSNDKKEDRAFQEIKIEFIYESEKTNFVRRTGSNIFAVNSPFEYQIVSISQLFADKLTTIGCNTIGVQNDRMDEQIKQFYDVMMLAQYCMKEMEFLEVREKYLARARTEWYDRFDAPFNLEAIQADVYTQLSRYAMADSGEDKLLKKYIADFKGLYLNSKIAFTPMSVSCAAMKIKMVYELLMSGENWNRFEQAQQIENILELSHLNGREKGIMTKALRIELVEKFARYSVIPPNILKSKSLKRIFWAVATLDNLDEIQKSINLLLK